MRLRHTVGAALGALTLVLALPTSASAGQFSFRYQYGDPASPTLGQMDDLDGITCYNVPEVEGKNETAFRPDNTEQFEVWVFAEEDCEGTKTTVPGQSHLGTDVKFKSFYIKS
ncbi:hypothetical protein [Streptomyces flavofungini]|uniref:Uncharacterized protein n=1 Tax=Streptomyces flavofungini TaxID=68200 RepID=A0ABS0X5E8_9ACTN|nr:hypothetical protein [Streptomyces flavofungini]MBJ3808430.1 hypothetical protein [Streptomyces flavofungini]GHC69536.1 hypothetical protein GCM10010349_44400 [Streptomyces flavofungini]